MRSTAYTATPSSNTKGNATGVLNHKPKVFNEAATPLSDPYEIKMYLEGNGKAGSRGDQIYTQKFVTQSITKDKRESNRGETEFQHSRLQKQSRKKLRGPKPNTDSIKSIPTYKMMGLVTPPLLHLAIKRSVSQKGPSYASDSLTSRSGHETSKQRISSTTRAPTHRGATSNVPKLGVAAAQTVQASSNDSFHLHLSASSNNHSLSGHSPRKLNSTDALRPKSTKEKMFSKSISEFKQSIQRITTQGSTPSKSEYHFSYQPVTLTDLQLDSADDGEQGVRSLADNRGLSRTNLHSNNPSAIFLTEKPSSSKKHIICSQHNMFRFKPSRESFVKEKYSPRLRLSQSKDHPNITVSLSKDSVA